MSPYGNVKNPDLLAKMTKWCSYRDRCESEATTKLKSLKATQTEEKEIIEYLIKNQYINDLRFAQSFARGKFQHNKWGKQKIKAELFRFRIAGEIIRKAIAQIDEAKYNQTIQKLFDAKAKALINEPDSYLRKQKIWRFLLSKGFTKQEVEHAIKNQSSGE